MPARPASTGSDRPDTDALTRAEYTIILSDETGSWSLFTYRESVDQQIHMQSWDSLDVAVVGATGVSTLHRMAVTFTSTRAECSINGGEATVAVLSGNDWPAAGYDCVLIDPSRDAVLKSITVYDPLPDATGLAALSALT